MICIASDSYRETVQDTHVFQLYEVVVFVVLLFTTVVKLFKDIQFNIITKATIA